MRTRLATVLGLAVLAAAGLGAAALSAQPVESLDSLLRPGAQVIAPGLAGKTNQDQNLGRHLMCSLSSARTVHAKQACSCVIVQTPGPGHGPRSNWQLQMRLDPGVNGKCGCQAVCLG